MTLDAEDDALFREWRDLTDAIAALERLAAAKSQGITSPNGDGDMEEFIDSLRAERNVCDWAISQCERLARYRERKR